MHKRISEIRKALNLTLKDFSSVIGLKPSTISDMEHLRCKINDRTIISICSKFNVNENWLRTGEGEMFNIIDKKFDEFFSIYNNLNEPLQDFLFSTAINLLDTQNRL